MAEEIQLDDAGRPLLTQMSEEGFVDCVFRIARASQTAEAHVLELEASHEGAVVGCRAIVRRDLRAGFDEEMEILPDRVYRSAVRLLRSGPESDELVTALARLYGQGDRRLSMVESIDLTGIVLHKEEVDMETMPMRIKLFGGEETDAFETYFEVHLTSGFVFWNEKDPDYRAALLGAVSAPRS